MSATSIESPVRSAVRRSTGAVAVESKVIFVSFAVEDEQREASFRAQSFRTRDPFVFVDLAVKRPDDRTWVRRARHRIEGCDAVIALVSRHTPASEGQAWELHRAREAGKPILSVWADSEHQPPLAVPQPAEWGSPEIAAFIDAIECCKPEWGARLLL
ncbi:TIR domain-containing protein [Microbacterium sp. AG1240]|uniref:TIR domain-containing protein n=1 Tax=Microbacterium sp. AG1240 TaxID=2183992 RepID=UPI000F1761CA|nr:TIR domain-containing protein [Microbacterium sp. AG1240]RKT31725.1 TIR domain-containing protein [Microbacterium sp. AG1240]